MHLNFSNSTKLNNLIKALAFIDDPYIEKLASILLYFRPRGYVDLGDKQKQNKDLEEVIILGWEWKMLIPSKSWRETLAWEDAIFNLDTSAIYKIPNIVACLVNKGADSGQWSPLASVIELCPILEGFEEWRIYNFISKLGRLSFASRVNVLQLKRISKSLGLNLNIDTLIWQFKAAGVFSPVLKPYTLVVKSQSPLYELNPSVFYPLS